VGILDEAIRDHLELKRQHGAENDELKRLEDEAFGPPTRPGEPDFPETGTATAEPGATNGDLEPATAEEEAADADAASVTAAEPDAAPPLESEAATEQPALTDPSEAETRLYDHSLEEDFGLAQPPAPATDEPPAAEAGAPPAEPAPETGTERAEPTVEPAESTPEPPAAAEPPIESLETVEHPLEPPSDELVEEEPPPEELVQEEPPSEELVQEEPPSEEHPAEPSADRAEGEPESSEEDVLADTPEFLRDAPEDDELWFEQGEPKDFDFDE
jgi:hypothetical protein